MLKKILAILSVVLFLFNAGSSIAFSQETDQLLYSSNTKLMPGVKLGDLPPIPALPDPATLPQFVLKPPSPSSAHKDPTHIEPMVTDPCLPGGYYDPLNPPIVADETDEDDILMAIGDRTDSEIVALCQDVINKMLALPGIGPRLAANGLASIPIIRGTDMSTWALSFSWDEQGGRWFKYNYAVVSDRQYPDDSIKRLFLHEIGHFFSYTFLNNYYWNLQCGTPVAIAPSVQPHFNQWEAEVSRRIFGTTIVNYWDTTFATFQTNLSKPHNISSREEIFAEVFSYVFQFDLDLLPSSQNPNVLWRWSADIREPLQDIKLYVYNMSDPNLSAVSVIAYPGYNNWPTDGTWPSALWVKLSVPFVPDSSPDGDPWFGLYQKFIVASYYANGSYVVDSDGFDPVRGYEVAFTTIPLYKICIGTPATQRTFNLNTGWNLIGNARYNANLYPQNWMPPTVWVLNYLCPNQAYNSATYAIKQNVDWEKDGRYGIGCGSGNDPLCYINPGDSAWVNINAPYSFTQP